MSTQDRDDKTVRWNMGLFAAVVMGGMAALILFAPGMFLKAPELRFILVEPMRSWALAIYSIAGVWGVIVVLTRGHKWVYYITGALAFMLMLVAIFVVQALYAAGGV